ncbi:MAG: globin-coupled sensor protein [Dehalococcoidia bacterium]|nr:globin-coupled sensor protein [Dehalococcoidia bacterium]
MAVQTLTQRLHVTPADQSLRLRWIAVTEADAELIRAAAPILRPHVDDIVKRFYDHSSSFAEWNQKITSVGSSRAVMEVAQKKYFLRILDGRFDEEYFEQRLKVGLVHAKLNVEPRWNVGNYSIYASIVFPLLAKKLKGDRLINTIIAFQKVFVLDMTLAVETFISEGVLEQLVDIHDNLGGPLKELGVRVGHVDTAAREIANAVDEIARGATSQTSALISMNADMQELSTSASDIEAGAASQVASIQQAVAATAQVEDALALVAEASNSAVTRGEGSLHAAEEGTVAVQQTVEAMDIIRRTVTESAGEIEELGKQGSQIGAIVQVIQDIAAQTNLLALNAAIEAARAGEQGRGFAVVAENVRSLAERTALATKEISDLISGVQRGTERAVKAMERSLADVETGSERAATAGDALGRIVESAGQVNTEISAIKQASASVEGAAAEMGSLLTELASLAERSAHLATDMSAASQRVVSAVADASAIAEEAAAASEQVSASAEEVSTQISEAARQSQSLASSTSELSGFIGRFGHIAHNSKGETFVPEKGALNQAA